jgi:hypothetical protein
VCEEYSKLIYRVIENPIPSNDQDLYIKFADCVDAEILITNGTQTEPKEFPHMVTT